VALLAARAQRKIRNLDEASSASFGIIGVLPISSLRREAPEAYGTRLHHRGSSRSVDLLANKSKPRRDADQILTAVTAKKKDWRKESRDAYAQREREREREREITKGCSVQG
jgi:hypothetical protein